MAPARRAFRPDLAHAETPWRSFRWGPLRSESLQPLYLPDVSVRSGRTPTWSSPRAWPHGPLAPRLARLPVAVALVGRFAPGPGPPYLFPRVFSATPDPRSVCDGLSVQSEGYPPLPFPLRFPRFCLSAYYESHCMGDGRVGAAFCLFCGLGSQVNQVCPWLTYLGYWCSPASTEYHSIFLALLAVLSLLTWMANCRPLASIPWLATIACRVNCSLLHLSILFARLLPDRLG